MDISTLPPHTVKTIKLLAAALPGPGAVVDVLIKISERPTPDPRRIAVAYDILAMAAAEARKGWK